MLLNADGLLELAFDRTMDEVQVTLDLRGGGRRIPPWLS